MNISYGFYDESQITHEIPNYNIQCGSLWMKEECYLIKHVVIRVTCIPMIYMSNVLNSRCVDLIWSLNLEGVKSENYACFYGINLKVIGTLSEWSSYMM